MKRKLDKNKVYAFIGKAVVFLSANLMWTGLMILGFTQNTIYQEEKMFYWLFKLEKKNKKLYKFCYWAILILVSGFVSIILALFTNLII